MTLTPITKLSTAIAFAATSTFAAAQTTIDTTTSGTTVVVPANGSTVVQTTTVPATPIVTPYGRAPSDSLMDRTAANMRAACAGLSDRQTERACKLDQHHGIVDGNPSKLGNDAGNSDDQAD